MGRLRFLGCEKNAAQPLTRDDVGRNSKAVDAMLEGFVEVTLADGSKIRCRPAFDLVKEYAAHFTPQTVEELTWLPLPPFRKLARHFGLIRDDAFCLGDGPEPVL